MRGKRAMNYMMPESECDANGRYGKRAADLSGGSAIAPPSAQSFPGSVHCAAKAVHLVCVPLTLVMPAAHEDVFSSPLTIAQVEFANIYVSIRVDVATGAVSQSVCKLARVASACCVMIGAAPMLFVVKPTAFVD